MRFVNYKLLDAVTANATILSSHVSLSQMLKGSLQVIIPSGTATGNIQLQASNDIPPDGALPGSFTPTNWSDIQSNLPITGVETDMIAQFDLCYRWIRVKYTDTSGGTGTGKITAELMLMGP